MTSLGTENNGQTPGAATPGAGTPGTATPGANPQPGTLPNNKAAPGAGPQSQVGGTPPTGPVHPNSRLGNLARGLKNPLNVKGLLTAAFALAVGGPPLIAGALFVADVGRGHGVLTAGGTALERTGSMWMSEVRAVGKVVDVVAAPFIWVIDGATGTGTGGARASFVKYCQPEMRLTALTPEQAQRRRDDQNYLRGAVSEHLRQPDSETYKIVKAGGFPVIMAHYSDPNNTRSEPGFTVQNVSSAGQQNCPCGYNGLTFNLP